MDFNLSEELVMVRDMARDFVTNELLPIERDVLVREKGGSRGAPIPADKREHLKKLAVEQGLWAMTAPEALGGGGLSTLGACLVAEELGKTFVDFDFGEIPPILFQANPEQQAKYLAPAIAGELECALALSEPDWSEKTEIGTRGVKDEHGWILNGTKLAKAADLYLVFAQTDQGPTCFIVERGGQGIVHDGTRLELQGAPVAAANILGEAGQANHLSEPYRDAGRARSAARKVGVAVRLLEMSSQYARDWKVLGQVLAVRPSVRRDLADMAVEIDAARWMVYHAASQLDEGHKSPEDALRALLFASDVARRAIDRTIEIYGGPGSGAGLPQTLVLQATSSKRQARANEHILELERFQIASNLING